MGLLSLMLLQESRHAARTSPTGELILLENQNRSFWNREQIAEGVALLEKALKSRRFGAYTLQAAIAAVHAEAESVAVTDWRQIVALYDRLLQNMVFMMSKSAYLYDEGDHNGPHLMSFTALQDGKDWGAGASGSPVVSGPCWFLSSKEPSQAKGLPPILVFAVEVAKWSDGTAAPMHQE